MLGLRPIPPAPPCRHARPCRAQVIQDEASQVGDPERKYKSYGRHFGSSHRLDLALWQAAPQIRLRHRDSVQREQLAELAVLNERLAGRESWEIRQKLEHLKSRRTIWELICQYVIEQDAVASLAAIEDAESKVNALLSEEAADSTSVAVLGSQLAELQAEVHTAHQRLHATEARVERNLQRVQSLRAEAAALERLRAQEQPAAAAAQVAAEAGLHRPGEADAAKQALAERAASHSQASSSSSSYALASPAAPVPSPGLASGSSRSSSSPTLAAVAAPANAPRQRALPGSKQQRRGLQSSLELEPGLKDYWYPVAFSSSLTADKLVPMDLFAEPWVLFRDASGRPSCVRDSCAHRACPLSLGKVVDGNVQCPYHGWQYSGEGNCVAMPSTSACHGISVDALACQEQDGFIWVWPGQRSMLSELPALAQPPKGYQLHAEIEVEVPVEHGLLLENLLDLAHAPFTHTSTFAKGWPIPEAVRFHAAQLLGGNWEPYPIDMSFEPPCAVLSTIGLAQPGKIMRGQRAAACKHHLHQLHVCLPSRPGHTRLLYRMSMDFMHWTQHVPGIQQFWKRIAGQVLGEDLVLVRGQQERLKQGMDTWGHPVSYDKLAVRYRRWRNSLGGSQADKEAAEASLTAMSAGQLFSVDEASEESELSCDNPDGCPV